jgi:hypothetical protein
MTFRQTNFHFPVMPGMPAFWRADRYSSPKRASEQIPVSDRHQTLDDGHPLGVTAIARARRFSMPRTILPATSGGSRRNAVCSRRSATSSFGCFAPFARSPRSGCDAGMNDGHADTGARQSWRRIWKARTANLLAE